MSNAAMSLILNSLIRLYSARMTSAPRFAYFSCSLDKYGNFEAVDSEVNDSSPRLWYVVRIAS